MRINRLRLFCFYALLSLLLPLTSKAATNTGGSAGAALSQTELSKQETSKKTVTVTGTVKDEKGVTLVGVNIFIKGTTTGTLSDLNGKYKIKVKVGQRLTFDYVGFKKQSFVIKANTKVLNVVMQENAEQMNETVVTAFGTGQKKVSMVGSVESIRPSELKIPAANLSASFAGRLAGIISVQRSGAPGNDGASFWIRGISSVNATSPLIVLDGVEISPGDLNSIDPDIISGFSILKDATATALYGSRGANGVVIVTTKTGQAMPKPVISVRIENYINTPTRIPKFVGGVEYMKLFNEALSNLPTGDNPYSQDKIEGTMQHRNPYVYPNVDWYNAIFKNYAFNQHANVNIRGGSKKIDYFMSVSMDHQTGMLKNIAEKESGFNNTLQVYRYTFQNNIRIRFTSTSQLALRINAQLDTWRGPKVGVGDIFGNIMNSNPVDFPIKYPRDPDLDYTRWAANKIGSSMRPNAYANAVIGYSENFSSTTIANLEFNQDLKAILKGLKFRALASFKNWSSTNTARFKGNNYFILSSYEPVLKDGKIVINPDGTYKYDMTISRTTDEIPTTLSSAGGNNGDRSLYFQAMLLWNRSFGNNNLNAMLNYNQNEYSTNTTNTDIMNNLPHRRQGIAGRLSYDYANRYLCELNFGYNGSENFAKGHRFGFFPSVAVGYNISEEKFWSPIKSYIPYLKLRASYGLVGNDNIGGARFVYLSSVNLGGGPGYTTNVRQNYGLAGPAYNRFANPEITWEIGRKLNIGIDLNLFSKLRLTLDVFRELRTDVFQQRGTVPSYFGTGGTKIYGNLGTIRNHGLDASLEYNTRIGNDLWISCRGSFTFAKNKVLKWDEPLFAEYPKLKFVGRELNTYVGYIAERLFIDKADVKNSPEQKFNGGAGPGDIKYKDLPDKDGKRNNIIDSNDREQIGYPYIPEIVYGFGTNIQYKAFDFGIFFQGVAHSSLMMQGFFPFGSQANRNVLEFVARNRWRPDNPNIYAKYPRLTKVDRPNNTQWSTYWLRDASFLKLKNIEIGYTYKSVRVYLSARNVYTFSKFKLWDPERGGGSGLGYPTQRTFNIGLQFHFK